MRVISKYWWIIAFQGLFLAIAGILVLMNEEVYLVELIEYLALNFLGFGGLIILGSLIVRKQDQNWWFLMLIGILELGVGLYLISNPGASGELFIMVIGGFAILVGLIQIVIGLFRKGSFLTHLINGLIAMGAGALIIINPFDTDKALTYMVSFFSIIMGIMIIYYSFVLRKWSRNKLKEFLTLDEASQQTEPEDRNGNEVSGDDQTTSA